jgi:hypothetical protein
VKLNWKLTTIKKTDAGYTLTYETPEGTKTVNARSLVLTVPAYVAKEILRPLSVCILPFSNDGCDVLELLYVDHYMIANRTCSTVKHRLDHKSLMSIALMSPVQVRITCNCATGWTRVSTFFWLSEAHWTLDVKLVVQ